MAQQANPRTQHRRLVTKYLPSTDVIIGLILDRRFAAEAVPSRLDSRIPVPTDLNPMNHLVTLLAFSGSAEGSDGERTLKPAARTP